MGHNCLFFEKNEFPGVSAGFAIFKNVIKYFQMLPFDGSLKFNRFKK